MPIEIHNVSPNKKTLVFFLFVFSVFFLFVFLVEPAACESSQARDETHATAATQAIAVTMPNH